jgi:hypothetical protein
METGTATLQNFDPLKTFNLHLCGFAFYKDDPNRQVRNKMEQLNQTVFCSFFISTLYSLSPLSIFFVERLCEHSTYDLHVTVQVELHHYCSCINDDVWQCLLFDGPTTSSRLVGIEYVISKRIFDTLPKEEQKYWHSHVYEVQSGTSQRLIALRHCFYSIQIQYPTQIQNSLNHTSPFSILEIGSLVAPRIPEIMEKSLMKDIINTYGKKYLLWQFDKDPLPLGEPKLMMVATKDGQWDPRLFQQRFLLRLPQLLSIIRLKVDYLLINLISHISYLISHLFSCA